MHYIINIESKEAKLSQIINTIIKYLKSVGASYEIIFGGIYKLNGDENSESLAVSTTELDYYRLKQRWERKFVTLYDKRIFVRFYDTRQTIEVIKPYTWIEKTSFGNEYSFSYKTNEFQCIAKTVNHGLSYIAFLYIHKTNPPLKCRLGTCVYEPRWLYICRK